MSTLRPEVSVARVANLLDGVFTRSQALGAGVTRSQVRQRLGTGLWVELLPGVYAHQSTPITTDLRRRSALLWAGRDAALSHLTAGALWCLDGVVERRIELTVARRLRSDWLTAHRDTLTPTDIVTHAGYRCTSPARTIIDLAGVLECETLERALESARRQRLVSVQAVYERLEALGTQGRNGSRALQRMLDRLDGRAASESVLEVKVSRLLRACGVPEPYRQHEVHVFGSKYRLDFAWPDVHLALECDGQAYHEFHRDRTRSRQLSASGWTVLPVTWRDVTTNWPAVVQELREAWTKSAS
ncbi:MAG TPA: DUF559 domain-containing protein [Acidimicrobiia bacterium]|nr:DUF559 domain-containing protein [Acidimicrobiia bacterium]